jgi:hypothetical protein
MKIIITDSENIVEPTVIHMMKLDAESLFRYCAYRIDHYKGTNPYYMTQFDTAYLTTDRHLWDRWQDVSWDRINITSESDTE